MRCLFTIASAVCWLVPALALAAETTVSVFTYNAEVFNSASATSNVIQQVDADIVGLQERSVFFFGGFEASDAAALGYHYHAFYAPAEQQNGPDTYTFGQNFLQRGAFKGQINDIPGFLNVSTNQFVDDERTQQVFSQKTYEDCKKRMQVQLPFLNKLHYHKFAYHP